MDVSSGSEHFVIFCSCGRNIGTRHVLIFTIENNGVNGGFTNKMEGLTNGFGMAIQWWTQVGGYHIVIYPPLQVVPPCAPMDGLD